MNLKTFRSCLLVSTFLIALQVQPKGSIVNLKGMTSKLTCLDHDEHKTSEQLSPTMGALFWESPFIINIHMFGPDDAMKRLINELFRANRWITESNLFVHQNSPLFYS